VSRLRGARVEQRGGTRKLEKRFLDDPLYKGQHGLGKEEGRTKKKLGRVQATTKGEESTKEN